MLRFGEKGFLWIEVEATGTAAHGAHVHLGQNAIDRLRAALDVVAALRDLPVAAPPAVTAAIAAAAAISEPLAGAGEARVLGSVTVNIGRIEGGTAPNLVPASARAACDIRLPVGVTAAQVEAALAAGLDALPGIAWRVLRRFEPNHTDPAADIVRLAHAAAEEVLGRPRGGEHARGRVRRPLVPHARPADRGLWPDARTTWAAPTNGRMWPSWRRSRASMPSRRLISSPAEGNHGSGHGPVAQWSERTAHNGLVAGSSPAGPMRHPPVRA